MRPWMLKTLNVLIFGLAVSILAGIETSLWKGLIPFLTEPTLWMFPVLYVAIHKSYRTGVVLCYVAGFVLKPTTGMPLSMLLVVILLTHGTVFFFKQRIFWNGLSYDISVASFAAVVVHIAPFVFSSLFDSNPPSAPSLGTAFGKLLITPIFVLPLFRLFAWIDEITLQTLSAAEEV